MIDLKEFTRMLHIIMKEDFKEDRAKLLFDEVNTTEEVIDDDGNPDVIASADALVAVLFSKGIFVSTAKAVSRFKLAGRLAISLRRASFVRDTDTTPSGIAHQSRHAEFQNLLKLQQQNRRASIEKRALLEEEESAKKLIVEEKDGIKGWSGGAQEQKEDEKESDDDEENVSSATPPSPKPSPGKLKLTIAVPDE
jgi:hypothetical protein